MKVVQSIFLLVGLLLAGAVFSGVFTDRFFENSSIVDDLSVLPVKESSLCEANPAQVSASFSAPSCIEPNFDFYIVHLDSEMSSYDFSLAKKVERTKAAFDSAKTKWAAAWNANQMPPVNFTATYHVLVPEGTVVSVPEVDVIQIPPQYLLYQASSSCTNPWKTCFVKADISDYIQNGNSTTSAVKKLSYRDRGAWGVGHLENQYKQLTNVPVLVVDKVKWHGSEIAGWTDTENGVISVNYLGFFNQEVGLFDQAMYNRMFAHEIGHILGLGEDAEEPDNLMTQMGNGGVGSSLDLYQAAKTKSILCTPGLRPVAVGKVQPLATGVFVASCGGDRLLHRTPGLQEQCNISFAGSQSPQNYLSANPKRFCPIIKIGNNVQPTPIAVTDDPTSPDFYMNVLSNYPGAKIQVCSNQCECNDWSPGTAHTPIPNRPTFVSRDTIPIIPVSIPLVPETVMDCDNYQPNAAGVCPANGWCPSGKSCQSTSSGCGCVNNPVCGNGIVESGEQCDASMGGTPICAVGELTGLCINCNCITENVSPGKDAA